jgi:hypothetical protein
MKRLAMSLLGFFFAAMSIQAGEPGVKQSIAYVQKLQTESGGFRAQEPKPNAPKIAPTLRATSSAVRALKFLGGKVPNKDACVKFVESCWNAEAGAFSDVPKGKPDVFMTAVGLLAVVELKMPIDQYADGASKYLTENAKTFEDVRIAAAGFEAIKKPAPKRDRWFGDILKTPNKEDGSFGQGPGQARDTASAAVTLYRLGSAPPFADHLLKLVKAGQRQNGGWGTGDSETASDLESTYRVMRYLMMVKARPDNVEGVRSFVAKCRNEDGGYGVAPGRPSSVGGTYFAAIVTHWLKEKP